MSYTGSKGVISVDVNRLICLSHHLIFILPPQTANSVSTTQTSIAASITPDCGRRLRAQHPLKRFTDIIKPKRFPRVFLPFCPSSRLCVPYRQLPALATAHGSGSLQEPRKGSDGSSPSPCSTTHTAGCVRR